MENHDKFYSFADAYDIAFDFKDIRSECSFLISVFEKYSARKPDSFLDVGSGPALHAIEIAKRGIRSAALDLSQEMVHYGLAKATKSKVQIAYFQANMYSFTLPRQFDLVGIFMDSASYLLTNESVISHLKSVAAALNSNAIYILEIAHPRDIFSVGSSTENSWEIEKDGLWTSVKWGDDDDFFDPITQITETTVALKIQKGALEEQLIEKAPQRCFICNEIGCPVRQ